MSDISELSEAKRILLEKYRKGNLQLIATPTATTSLSIKAQEADARARVIQVQAGGSKRPFFFLHGSWKGTPFFCLSLARELGEDRPFYALEPYSFDGLAIPPTIETMAAAHIQTMRTIQPKGPYLLGGWCNGGLVAYEMARQLDCQGETVDFLVLMDAMYIGGYTRRSLARIIINRLGNMVGFSEGKQVDWFLRQLSVSYSLKFFIHAFLHIHKRLEHMNQTISQDSLRLMLTDTISFGKQIVITGTGKLMYVFEHNDATTPPIRSHTFSTFSTEALRQDYLGIVEWISRGYKPASLYPGKITFFWPSKEPWHTISRGWHKVIDAKNAQDVEMHIIPGNQDTWRTQHLSALIECLKTCFRKACKEMS